MIDPQTKVIAQVIQERKNQDRQWGGQVNDDKNGRNDWEFYIERQLSMLEREQGQGVRQRFIKIAALAVAAVESLDRKANENQGNATSDPRDSAEPCSS